MNRVVREHYPVSKLPEDLREGFGPDDDVRVTIDAGDGDIQHGRGPGITILARSKHHRRSNFLSDQSVDDYVRSLRDEWSDRDQ